MNFLSLQLKAILAFVFLLPCSFVFAQNLNLDWVHQRDFHAFDGFSSILYSGMESDLDGNIYYFGNFKGTIDFDPSATIDTITSTSGRFSLSRDAFISKFDSLGNYIQTMTFTSTGDAAVSAIAFHSNGNIAVCGQYAGTLNIGGSSLQSISSQYCFVANLDPSGSAIWAYGVASDSSLHTDISLAIDTDTAGNIFYLGSIFKSLKIDEISQGRLTPGGFTSSAIIKFSQSGAVLYIHGISANMRFIHSTDDGKLILGGISNRSKTHIDGTEIFTDSTKIFFFSMADRAGTSVVWSKNYGGSLVTDMRRSRISGNQIIFAGSSYKALSGAPSITGKTLYLMSLDLATGNNLWTTTMKGQGTSHQLYDFGIVEDTIVALGKFSKLYFNNDSIESDGSSDIFLISLDKSGNIFRSQNLGGKSSDQANHITTIGKSIVLSGRASRDCDFDFDPNMSSILSSTSSVDFMSRYKFGSSSPTAIDEDKLIDMTAYPNPVEDSKLNIRFSEIQVLAEIELVSLSGQVLLQEKIKNSNKLELNVASLVAGMYFVRIQSGSKQSSVKIVVK